MKLPRRAFLCGLASVPTLTHRWARADADPSKGDLDVREVPIDGGTSFGRAFVLATPRHVAPGERVPLVVLLHGLGETVDPRLGMRAWHDRYGLATAYARLRHPPLTSASARDDWGPGRLAEINAALAARPFRGLAFACPFTPNVNKAVSTATALTDYARWITDVLLPRARAEASVLADARHTGIDGCSLGGFVGLEVFLRKPAAFGAWGGVQTAISEAAAPAYAERVAAAFAATGARPLHVETSSLDPFRKANVAFAAALRKRGIAHDLTVRPGPHDQPWLRESGTASMLAWLDAQLA